MITPGGIIRLTVTDTAATDEDLILMEGGLIFTNEADITLRVGDDVDTRLESGMFTPSDIFVFGDFGDADPGLGSRIVLRGAMIADRTTINTLRDADEVRIENGILNTFIITSGGDDLIFGSDAGTDDPNLTDTTYFGDFIDAGPGQRPDLRARRRRRDLRRATATTTSRAARTATSSTAAPATTTCAAASATIRSTAAPASTTSTAAATPTSCSARTTTTGSAPAAARINVIFGGAGDDVLNGSDEGADGIVGGAGRDYIFGYGGNDILLGGADDDIIDGGAGDDIIQGGAGKDVLVGGADHDQLFGHDTTTPTTTRSTISTATSAPT